MDNRMMDIDYRQQDMLRILYYLRRHPDRGLCQ